MLLPWLSLFCGLHTHGRTRAVYCSWVSFFSMIRAMSHEGSMFGSTCAKKISKPKTSHDSHVCSFVTRAVELLELPFINAEVAKAFGLLPQLAAVPLGLCLSDDIVEDLLGAHFSGTFLKVTCAAWIWGNLQLRARRYEKSVRSNCFLRSSRRLEIWSWFQGVVGITEFFVAVAYSLLTIIQLRKIGK